MPQSLNRLRRGHAVLIDPATDRLAKRGLLVAVEVNAAEVKCGLDDRAAADYGEIPRGQRDGKSLPQTSSLVLDASSRSRFRFMAYRAA